MAVRGLLLALIALAVLPASTSAAGCAPLKARICYYDTAGWASRYFGGVNHVVDNDTEIVQLINGVTDMDRTLDGLSTQAERDLVIQRGILPSGPARLEATPTDTIARASDPAVDELGDPTATVEPESGGATTPAAPATDTQTSSLSGRTYSGSRTYTFSCVHESTVHLIVWRYNSRWTWGWSAGKVRWARHWEYASGLYWFWQYGGSRYLWPSGGINQWYIGRATQGTFTFAHGVVWTIKPIINVHVHGDGGAWYSCAT